MLRLTAVLVLVLTVFAPAGARTTQSLLDGWLAATPQIVRSTQHSNLGSLHQQIELRDASGVSGFVSPEYAVDGSLAQGQRVMIVPLISGGSGGVFYTLLFTQLGGRTRFVGYIPSPNGHLEVTIDRGELLIRTPIYGPGSGGNCCPSDFHYERATLHGIRLITLKSWAAKAPKN